MINPIKFIKFFKRNNITFFTGVPDSTLKNFTYLLNKEFKNHYPVYNEGSAVSLAIGYHLAKKTLKKGWQVTSISTKPPKKARYLGD